MLEKKKKRDAFLGVGKKEDEEDTLNDEEKEKEDSKTSYFTYHQYNVLK